MNKIDEIRTGTEDKIYSLETRSGMPGIKEYVVAKSIGEAINKWIKASGNSDDKAIESIKYVGSPVI